MDISAFLCFGFTSVLMFVDGMSGKELPEVHMTVPEIIRYNGYPAEVHDVTTEDGYILSIHRIPQGTKGSIAGIPRPVVFLQHGLLAASSNWVTNPPDQGFAFVLADEGFDVWMGNVRGNTYGLRHRTLDVNSDAFWWFSWDEMAKYDLPAMVDYVVNNTGLPQLYYIGHSQGTMIAFAAIPLNKALASKIKTFFAMGPVTTFEHMKSPLKYLFSITPELEFLFKLFGVRDFLPSNELTRWLADFVCQPEDLKFICANIVFVLAGFDRSQLNETRLPIYVSHTPAGTSVRNLVHYAQVYKTGKFQAYDFGEAGNMKHYGTPTPPPYNASALDVPVALYWGGNDWLADPTDVKYLLNVLPKNKIMYNKEIKAWDHLDFVWGMDAAKLVYCDIVAHIKKYNNLRSPFVSSACN